jgi:hypothetical protein
VRHWFAHNGARPGTVVRDRIVALSGIIGTVIAPSRDHALRDPARHIADIKTPNGLVIEFQHSAIKPDEVEKRTNFYGQVIWIIDGTRRPTDLIQYERMFSENRAERFDGVDIYTVYCEESRLLKEWGSLGRIVGFDFGGDNLCLLTASQGRSRYLFDFPKAEFAKSITEGSPLPVVQFAKPTQRGYRRRRSKYSAKNVFCSRV